jgi:hypothetical protein
VVRLVKEKGVIYSALDIGSYSICLHAVPLATQTKWHPSRSTACSVLHV